MTDDQMQDEHDRLQRVLEAHDARAIAGAAPERRDGLRTRIASLARKLSEGRRA